MFNQCRAFPFGQQGASQQGVMFAIKADFQHVSDSIKNHLSSLSDVCIYTQQRWSTEAGNTVLIGLRGLRRVPSVVRKGLNYKQTWLPIDTPQNLSEEKGLEYSQCPAGHCTL